MGNLQTISLLTGFLACIPTVQAHGYVKNIVINGVSYQGYDPTVFPYQSNPPIVVGWTTSQTDLGYVEPAAFGTSDIICHRGSKPAGGHARVAAGDSIALTWNTWPDSHHGPIIDYLAPCNGPCESVEKTALKFFKIDGAGKADPSATSSPGYWADDVMMANGLTWLVQIPASITPGNYVLRHEIIALHSANNANGAQAYPQCFNLEVIGSGTNTPDSVLGTQLYKNNDPGIAYNLYTTPQPSYTVPGPTLIAGVPSSVAQSSSAITKSTSATVGYTSATSSSSITITASDSQASTSSTTTTSKSSTTASSSSTTSTTSTTSTSKTTTTSASTGSVPSESLVPLYGQCGGRNWQGSSQCAQQKVACQYSNDYYSQCVLVPA
ncbi:glycosyl hydrolase family 61-domain-containing protein [Truncatella angustata]|uniref:lytic cellulose monooxygenase (C4-dehydrogenating) n=1 Tax=Truncatella angustata TaxID=152316 RepID=A0A9P8ZY19_9PEZI|nr:glycosyl hydrolase family 61-domain-containing protein [Truncatella angustata]KAH6655551.1 glycosyl hydrolase family 61-domain-containing protein [Truncatella angustata]